MSRRTEHAAIALLPERHLVRPENRLVSLTPSEFGILAALVQAGGKPVCRRALQQAMRRRSPIGNRSLDTTVRNLRRILGDDGRQQRIIETVIGTGYAIAVRLLD
jgi:DNA-binding response OmpR family regulator